LHQHIQIHMISKHLSPIYPKQHLQIFGISTTNFCTTTEAPVLAKHLLPVAMLDKAPATTLPLSLQPPHLPWLEWQTFWFHLIIASIKWVCHASPGWKSAITVKKFQCQLQEGKVKNWSIGGHYITSDWKVGYRWTDPVRRPVPQINDTCGFYKFSIWEWL
jgi:hypothetical protein